MARTSNSRRSNLALIDAVAAAAADRHRDHTVERSVGETAGAALEADDEFRAAGGVGGHAGERFGCVVELDRLWIELELAGGREACELFELDCVRSNVQVGRPDGALPGR